MTAEVQNGIANLEVNENGQKVEEDVVDPWNVVSTSETGVDYDKLISKFFRIFY